MRLVWTRNGPRIETGERLVWTRAGARIETVATGGGSLAPDDLAAGVAMSASSFTQTHVFTGAGLVADAAIGASSFLQDHQFSPANLFAGTILSSGSWPGAGGVAPRRPSPRRLPVRRRSRR